MEPSLDGPLDFDRPLPHFDHVQSHDASLLDHAQRSASPSPYDDFFDHTAVSHSRRSSSPPPSDGFSFSFSEDDLIPVAPSYRDNDFHDFFPPPQDPQQPSATIYSGSPEFAEPKISVQRTVVLPEPQRQLPRPASVASAASAPPRSKSPAQKTRSSLSKTFSFARKKKSSLRDKAPPVPELPAGKPFGLDQIKKQQANNVDSGYGSSETKRRSEHSPPLEPVNGKLEEPVPEATTPKSIKQQRRRSIRGIFNKPQEPEVLPPLPSPKKRPATPNSNSLPNSAKNGPSPADASPRPTSSRAPTASERPSSFVSQPIPVPKKDELAGVFKSLESDFSKFQSKSLATKTGVVRASLIPFLRTHANHPSVNALSPENLNKRIIVLNKWWTGLLDLLNGKNNHNISGTDRPVLLEGMSGIMERPEWRIGPSAFAPLASRSDFGTSNGFSDAHDAIYTNVQNMFVQKLFAQMSMVVERMSLRHTPASIVTFCGKACAYAFFFCPGIADILVRLWEVPHTDLKHMMDASGARNTLHLKATSETVASRFPPCLRNLAFVSLRDTTRRLRERPVLPMGVEHIQWYGIWLSRWTGSDSDLFYVFLKHYHLLASDYFPPDSTKTERLCAPGFLIVQAQALNNLNSTVHRAATDESEFEAATTFDDIMGAESMTAAAGAAPPANASRLMAENRLVMLLRDLLIDRDTPYPISHIHFAEHFGDILKASALSTSLYDHNSCFTLCDFLQEAFIILFRFQNSASPTRSLIDWPFWLKVFRKMVASQNTMTEIRLYSLLFSIWGSITSVEGRKTQLCLDFLLESEHFDATFNHWCPMVRAYFMRLLCWRIARFDGDASDADLEILKALMERLQGTWSYFSYEVEQALRDEDNFGPSTAPCNPAPGRRLLIIRTDTLVSHSLLNIATTPLQTRSPPESDQSEGGGPDARSLVERLSSALEPSESTKKKRTSLFGSMFSSNKGSGPPSRSDSPSRDDSGDSEKAASPGSGSGSREPSPERRNGARASMYEHRPAPVDSTRKKSTSPAKRPHLQASFKFSLEFVDRRPHNLPVDMFLQPPRVPLAAQLLLQAQPDFNGNSEPVQPNGAASRSASYMGRALAEWTLVVNECQNFFERRRNEGVPSNKQVETPILGVESFRRPG